MFRLPEHAISMIWGRLRLRALYLIVTSIPSSISCLIWNSKFQYNFSWSFSITASCFYFSLYQYWPRLSPATPSLQIMWLSEPSKHYCVLFKYLRCITFSAHFPHSRHFYFMCIPIFFSIALVSIICFAYTFVKINFAP